MEAKNWAHNLLRLYWIEDYWIEDYSVRVNKQGVHTEYINTYLFSNLFT